MNLQLEEMNENEVIISRGLNVKDELLLSSPNENYEYNLTRLEKKQEKKKSDGKKEHASNP